MQVYNQFLCFSYDKASLKFCASFRFFLAVFMEKFQKIHYLNYVRRGIAYVLHNKLCVKGTFRGTITTKFDRSTQIPVLKYRNGTNSTTSGS